MEKTIKFLVCDICGMEITRDDKVELNGSDWDLCNKHKEELGSILIFLTINVGLDIKYKFKPGIEEAK